MSVEKKPTDVFNAIIKVKQTAKDEEVTLTAKFKAEESHLNNYLGEKQDNFPKLEKKFKFKVKKIKTESAEELKALLDKYYKGITLQDTKNPTDLKNITSDLQLPIYTRIKDEKKKQVFINREITVTTDNPAAKVNGYRVVIDPFYKDNKSGNLIVKMERNGVSATKKIPFTIGSVSEDILDKEIQMMEAAKLNYFEGIKGTNSDKDKIKENLKAFQEMTLNKEGNPVWAYNYKDKTDLGIIPDNFWSDDKSVEMEASGYNKFKSSNSGIIRHDNLRVIRPEASKKINISSLLSSAKFGKFAPAHRENEKLQKLYKQPVSVDLVVLGTKSSEPPTDEPSDNKVTEANITLRGLSEANKLNFNKKIKVTSQDAISAGYEKPEEFKNVVTSQDAIVTMHREMFKDFNDNPKKYLNISGSMINKVFGIDTINLMLYRNHKTPKEGSNWLNVSNITLKEGDDFTVFILQDTNTYKDMYTIITPESVEVEANKKFALEVKGFLTMGDDQPEALKGYVVTLSDGKSEYKATSNKDGIVEFEVPSEGEYIATVAQAPESLGKAIIPSTAIVVIKKSASEPVEPKEPSKPSNPVEPKEPSTPSDPVEPKEPSTPSDPVEPEEPSTPSDSTEPKNPSNQNDPEGPHSPTESEQHGYPDQQKGQGNNSKEIQIVVQDTGETVVSVQDSIVKYVIGESKGLTLRALANFRSFKGVYMDGKLVDPVNYKVYEGSIIIDFNKDYINKLGIGEHVATIKTKEGDGKIKVLVSKSYKKVIKQFENNNIAKTGDNQLIGINVLVMMLSMIIIYFAKRKKRTIIK